MRAVLGEDNKPKAWSYHNLSPSILGQGDFLSGLVPDWLPRFGEKALLRSATNLFKTGTIPDLVATEGANESYYDVENFECEYTPINVDIPVAFWRSVGHSYNGFVVESFIDELAFLAKQDPYDYRRSLLKRSRDKIVLERVAKMAGWGAPLPEGVGRGIAVHKSFGTFCAEVADVRIVNGKIVVDRMFCAVDPGLAVNPDMVKAQMESCIIYGLSAALMQEITMVDGVVQQANFNTYPMLRMHECPTIEIEIVESGGGPTGVGEPGLPPVAPAVANALFNLTGVRLRSMPLQKAWDKVRGSK